MSISEPNSTPQAGDLSQDFEWGCECALPHLETQVTYLYVGRGALPEATPTATYVRAKFEPSPQRS